MILLLFFDGQLASSCMKVLLTIFPFQYLMTVNNLMNPFGVHFSNMRASDLLLLDANITPSDYGHKVDPTAWWIHGAMHRNNPHARCIVHLHSHYATALSALKDPSLPPIDQTSCRYFNRVSVDIGFNGMGLDGEAERLSKLLGNKRLIMMGNHGFLSVAESPALAFDLAYYFERGCRTYLTALSTGAPLAVLPDNIAEKDCSSVGRAGW